VLCYDTASYTNYIHCHKPSPPTAETACLHLQVADLLYIVLSLDPLCNITWHLFTHIQLFLCQCTIFIIGLCAPIPYIVVLVRWVAIVSIGCDFLGLTTKISSLKTTLKTYFAIKTHQNLIKYLKQENTFRQLDIYWFFYCQSLKFHLTASLTTAVQFYGHNFY